MGAQAAITLTDAESTPVNHVMNPVGIADGIAKWVDRAGGIAIGFPALTLSMREPTKGQPVPSYKVAGKLIYPVLDVTSPSTMTGIQPQPTVAYLVECNFSFTLPERSTTQVRKNIRAMIADLFGEAVFKSYVEDLEPTW